MRKMCVQRVAARLYAVVSGRKLQALPNITKAVFAGACAMMVCLAVPAGAAGSFCMPAAAAAASTRVEDIDAGEASESMENPGNGESISAVRAEGDGIQQGGLTIEVVEELSIDDQIIIDDGEIPLANYSEASADDGPRHAAMMGLVLVCAAGYATYCSCQEKKLFELRRTAARAQKESMQRQA